MSPEMMLVLLQSARFRVFETTYFGDLAQEVGELGVGAGPGGRRPERRPDLPRPPAEQHRVGRHGVLLVEQRVLIALDAQGPGVASGPMLVEPGRLDDTVEGHERRRHELHGSTLAAETTSPTIRLTA
jgi:hypothetical protein